MFSLLTKIFASRNKRIVASLMPIVEEINKRWEDYKKLEDNQLPKMTEEFKQRLKEGETLDDLLIDAYALVKESTRRLLGKKWLVTEIEKEWDMVPYDVQLIGAIVLHQGKIAEMATGEGKTLVATMPLYLNALTGKGCHLVTVNDYLARRDREWMGPVYESLGITVGVIQMGMTPEERKIEYSKDITYGTNNEFGFDYLRDNMAVIPEHRVQRGHYYAIVDEVDSVLIDEARTPLIISGPVDVSVQHYEDLKPAVERVYKMQNFELNKLVVEAERKLKAGELKEAGEMLLMVKRGAPKNRLLMKLMHEPGVQQLIEETEASYLKEKKMSEIDERLYFSIDEKANIVDISEKGRNAIAPKDPDFFTLPDLSQEIARIDRMEGLLPREKLVEKEAVYRRYAEKSEMIHCVHQLLRAYSLFEKDVEYIVQNGKVVIVDEFTGRLMPGRRYSDGLHQAIEAKENVKVEKETQTLATITLQNYFRMYEKLAGMTGTAATEANEFWEIYKLDVVVIPTNKPIRRIDYDDLIFRTKKEKYQAVVNEIKRVHKTGRPILVGTVSVEVSEILSKLLKRENIPHQVLNAKYHQKEAEIIAHAGEFGRVTIATNMAGRGTDIKLEKGVVKCETCLLKKEEALSRLKTEEERRAFEESLKKSNADPEKCIKDMECGLYIIGTERHEARRIDLQLKGRSGRQGDPGSSRFFVSLEDDIMRLFATERISSAMDRMGIKEGEPLKHKLVTRALENAQKRVERFNFDIRKRLLEYDDVMNKQREVIYSLRNEILDGKDLKERVIEYIEDVFYSIFDEFATSRLIEEWDIQGLRKELVENFLIDINIGKGRKEEIEDTLLNLIKEKYEEKERIVTSERMREYERIILLQSIDANWRHHLYELDALKEGISLRGYAQKDPLVEYKREAFAMFEELMFRIEKDAVRILFRFRPEAITLPEEVFGVEKKEEFSIKSVAGEKEEKRDVVVPQDKVLTIGDPVLDKKFQEAISKMKAEKKIKSVRDIGRNEPCPCGSGKKFKKCHGRDL
uniref:Protein translocase subunit SecA n=1 Tax=candidate division WOR-3 bacterium TaxID=2052148 RepID=A0A7C4U7P2_UNCW3